MVPPLTRSIRQGAPVWRGSGDFNKESNCMRQGTTPVISLTVPGYDLTDKTVFVTFRDSQKKDITKTGDDVTVAYSGGNSSVLVKFSQKETLDMATGAVKVQIRFIDADGHAEATNIAEISNLHIILKREIEYHE